MDGRVLRCGIGPVPRGNGTAESKTTPAVCKVFVPAIVSKCLPMMRGAHAVIISVSQGHDIVAVPSNDDEGVFFLFFCSSVFDTLKFFSLQQALLRKYSHSE